MLRALTGRAVPRRSAGLPQGPDGGDRCTFLCAGCFELRGTPLRWEPAKEATASQFKSPKRSCGRGGSPRKS
eukprot:4465014-Pyramimonas_sp.AAC.1